MKTIKPFPFEDKISLKTAYGIEIFNISEIIQFYIENKKVKTLLLNGQITMLFSSLSEIEGMLAPFHFYRCHAKNVINIAHVSRYNHKTGYIQLGEHIELQVAFHRRTQIKKLIYSMIPVSPQSKD